MLRRIAIGTALVALLVWAFRPQPVPVDLTVVDRGALMVTVDDEGETRVRDRYVVSAPVPGRMRRVELEPGDPVVAGRTVLVTFEPADPTLVDSRSRAQIEARVRAAEAAVGSARAETERSRTELEFAERELARYGELAEEGIASREQLDAAQRQARALEDAARSAEFRVRTAEHEREVARASLLQERASSGTLMRLYSPVDGVVLKRYQESEAVRMTGEPLMEVGDLSGLEIVSDLLSSAATQVRVGQRVRIEQWGGEQPLAGRVRRVEPSGFTKISALGVEEQRVNVIVDFEEPREAREALGDAYRVEIRIVVSEREDVLKVPTSSLFRYEDGWAVFQVIDGAAVLQSVETGERNGLEAEVLGGVAAGDQVIMFPSDDVTDGVAVIPRE